MSSYVNILPRTNALMSTDENGRAVSLATFAHDWTSTNSVMSIISNDFVVDSRYTIRLAPSSADTVVLTLADIELKPADNESPLSFNAKIKCNSSFRTSTKLYLNGDDTDIDPYVQRFSGGEYNAVHSNVVVIPPAIDASTATVEISITQHSAATLFITLPHLIKDAAFADNFFIQQGVRYLPDFYLEIDGAQSGPRYPFFKLIDALTSTASDTRSEYEAIFGFESDELDARDEKLASWGSSVLVSPSHVRDEYISWLAQFSGHNVTRNFTLNGGSVYFTNAQLERDFIEWQLRTSFYGRGAGTRRAMIDAGKQVLVRTKDGEPSTRSLALTQRFGGDPFAILIQTLTNETFDANENESSDLVLKSVNMAKPIGYKVTHNTVDEFYFTLDDLTLGVIGEQKLQ